MEKWLETKLKALERSQRLIEDANEKLNVVLEEIKDIINPIITQIKERIIDERKFKPVLMS